MTVQHTQQRRMRYFAVLESQNTSMCGLIYPWLFTFNMEALPIMVRPGPYEPGPGLRHGVFEVSWEILT